jgi:hypothetical protein
MFRQVLATPSAPTLDFGDENLRWYWDGIDTRSQNLAYIYKAILNYCMKARRQVLGVQG